MINLFNIPDYIIDTAKFSNKVNDPIVEKFENDFSNFVGAKFACGFNSATNALFLSMLRKDINVTIPSIIPPVVLNSIINSGNKYSFNDNIEWVGDSYTFYEFDDYKIIDSAQKVERDQFKNEANSQDLMIFSFYPTKPVGGIDGGMIVSDDKDKIDWFKKAVMNGMSYRINNWERKIEFPGWKMYLSSTQAYVADKNLSLLESKQRRLREVREFYNLSLGYNNTSNHLYRISVRERDSFINKMRDEKIICGIHYSPAHNHLLYLSHSEKKSYHLPLSENVGKTTVSIPYHEKLTDDEVENIIKTCIRFTDY